MAAAPVADGKDNSVDRKARNVVVKSEIMENDDYSVPQDTVLACGNPAVTFPRFTDDVRFPEYEDGDRTECSSSFDASYSVSDDELELDTGTMEVNSILQSNINVDDSTSVPHLVGKRKVTAEWRKYIGPIMWRCQWLELRMKDLLSQVDKYDKELEMMNVDSHNSGLLQLDQSHDRNTMKRRKRKRDEDIMEDSWSTEKHLILSYYNEKQKKKTEMDELLDDDDVNSLAIENMKSSLGLDDTWAWLEFKENDTVSEQYSLREILFSINGMQSRISSLQNHLWKALNTTDHSQKTKKVQKKKNLHTFLENDAGSIGITRADGDEITVEMLFGNDNPLIDAGLRGLYKETIKQRGKKDIGSLKGCQKAEKHQEPVNKSVDETPLEENDAALMEHESVSVPAPVVMLVKKRGPKLKNKHSTKKKSIQEDHGNSNIERTMLVAVDTRRSQRVRKPKIL